MTSKNKLKRGYAVLETIVAVALLSAAMVGLAKTARVHSVIRHSDELRLSAQLVATNLVESLRGKFPEAIEKTLGQAQVDSPIMQIRTEQIPFSTEKVVGIHVIVSVHEQAPVRPVEQPLAREHFWILQPTAEKSATEGAL